MTVQDRLQQLVARTLRLPIDDVTDALDMNSSARWDSLSHMQLVAAIEDEFALELTADEIVTMTSVAAIRHTLRRRSVMV